MIIQKNISPFRKFNLLKTNIYSEKLAMHTALCLIVKVKWSTKLKSDVLDLGPQYGKRKGKEQGHW